MKNLKWVILLIAVTLIGDRLGGWVMKTLLDKSQFRFTRLYNGSAESDILLLGNSRGLVFFQPEIEQLTGKKTFNLSYNGMPGNLADVFIKDYYDKYDAPKVLLIELGMTDRWNNIIMSGFNPYTPFSPRLSTLMRDSLTEVYYGGKVSHLFRYNSEVFQRALYHIRKPDTDWLLDRVISNEMVTGIVRQKPYTINLDKGLYIPLKKLIATAEKHGTKVHLLINPYFPAFAQKITNLKGLIKVVEQETGHKVYDYSKAISETEYFGDYQHLNKAGARKYMKILYENGLFE